MAAPEEHQNLKVARESWDSTEELWRRRPAGKHQRRGSVFQMQSRKE